MFFTKWFTKQTKEVAFLIGISLLFFLLRFPSFYEPYWYGDEGIYFTIGKALHAGRDLYSGIWDNKPPLLYWFYALFNDLFSIRFVSMLFGIGAIISFFLLSQRLFIQRNIQYLTTSLFALFFALPSIEGNIANAENFMLFPIITAALFFWLADQEKEKLSVLKKNVTRQHLYIISGVLLGIACLFKTVGMFDLAAFSVFAFFVHFKNRVSLPTQTGQFLKTYTPFFLSFLLPLGLTSLYFLIQGTLPELLETIFLRNALYVGEKNALFLPHGFIVLKLGLLLFTLLILFRQRRVLPHPLLFVLLWLSFSVFNAFFSQRPYTHYQLVALPSIILTLGMVFTVSALRQKVILAVLVASITFVFYHHFDHWNTKKTLSYYQNFLSFLSGKKSSPAYKAFFDGNTPNDYNIADYLELNTNPNEKIFIWGNSPQIYYLSRTLPTGRYSVAYHIITDQAMQETAKALQENPPKYLVVMPNAEPIPFTMPGYSYKLTLNGTVIYERTY